MVEQTPLPARYYRDNFVVLVQSVSQRYLDLFDDTEQAHIQALLALDQDAQCLLVRLLTRVGPWVRSDQLNYPEILDLELSIARLEAQGWISTRPELDVLSLSRLLRKAELQALWPALPKAERKAQWQQRLYEQYTDAQRPLQQWWPKAPMRLLSIERYALLHRLQVLFFASNRPDLSQFVIVALGHQRFESYPLHPQYRAYANRHELEWHIQRGVLREALAQASLEDTATDAEVRAQLLARQREVPSQASTGLWLALAERAAKRQDWRRALSAYRRVATPPGPERVVRTLGRLGRWRFAERAMNAIIPQTDTERNALERFRASIHKALDKPTPKRSRFWAQSFTLCLPDDGERVERQVQRHLRNAGWQSLWCENALLSAIFGLMYWEVIFADVPYAFDHAFQRGPRDQYHPQFWARRAALRAQCEAQWQARASWACELQRRYEAKAGVQNRWFHAERVPWSAIAALLARMDKPVLWALLQRLASDLRHYRSGLPDLFAWREQQYRFIEVKGPGDRLQESQTAWLAYFAAQDVHYDVAIVTRP